MSCVSRNRSLLFVGTCTYGVACSSLVVAATAARARKRSFVGAAAKSMHFAGRQFVRVDVSLPVCLPLCLSVCATLPCSLCSRMLCRSSRARRSCISIRPTTCVHSVITIDLRTPRPRRYNPSIII